MTKPLHSYEPTSREVYTGIGSYTEHFMEEMTNGSYISRFDLVDGLKEMLENACDPGEKDALNAVIAWVNKA
jgi:hypothetical protein